VGTFSNLHSPTERKIQRLEFDGESGVTTTRLTLGEHCFLTCTIFAFRGIRVKKPGKAWRARPSISSEKRTVVAQFPAQQATRGSVRLLRVLVQEGGPTKTLAGKGQVDSKIDPIGMKAGQRTTRKDKEGRRLRKESP